MKGATHNLIVRTRTDVALYVLNHKRGHLRDLENSFKVTLAVIADPNVSGQQSFVIDRGEQVHTLEAAKLLAAQVAAFPPPLEEEPFVRPVPISRPMASVARVAVAVAVDDAGVVVTTKVWPDRSPMNSDRRRPRKPAMPWPISKVRTRATTHSRTSTQLRTP
jgi:hypothetical protein